MSELISSLQFFIYPLLSITLLGIVLIFVGTFITLRKDILSAIAYPNFSYGIISLLVLFGISFQEKTQLFILTAIIVIAFSFISFKNNSKRMLYWSVLFSCGIALSLFAASFSWLNQSHLKNLFQAEIMVINQYDFLKISIIILALTSLFVFFKPLLFNLVIYPENLLVKNKKKYHLAKLVYQFLTLISIIMSSLYIGPFLTISFLLIPVFFSIVNKSFFSFLLNAIFVCIFSIVIGFSISIFLDVPPTPLIVLSNLVFGSLVVVIKKLV